ncbi:FadR/GntR family transcriptional regulator [Neisseria weixii]|uniref:FadR/GntR family transcriptional regulator n=1 Tax=Neisseria weixii TaxID=1853276 RepID=UPI0035A073D7
MRRQALLSENNAVRLPSIGGQIAAIIEERILKNVYPIGFKLPPERQLAEDFNVSRQSVRAALRILATRGMIQSRQGDGHYVSEKVEKNFQFGWEDILGEHGGLEQDVLDFRRGLEGLMASLAAQRRTEGDLKRMRNWLDELRRSYEEEQIDRQSVADVAFHQAVAEATHNLLFTRLSDSLLRLLHRHTRRNLANMFGSDRLKNDLMEQHEAIYAAIERRDGEAAARAAGLHLDYVRDSLQRARDQHEREAVSNALVHADERKKK